MRNVRLPKVPAHLGLLFKFFFFFAGPEMIIQMAFKQAKNSLNGYRQPK